MIKNLYLKQTAAMRVDGEISSFKKKIKHLSDRDICSPRPLFSLTMKYLCETLKDTQEIKVRRHNVNNFRYANDTVLIAKNKGSKRQLYNCGTKKKKTQLKI